MGSTLVYGDGVDDIKVKLAPSNLSDQFFKTCLIVIY